MGRGSPLGEFEQLILLAVVRLAQEEASGMAVRREIQSRTERDVAIGAVYATLDRLEAKGLVLSRVGEATAARGGRAKRLFEITGQGAAALNQARQDLLGMLDGLAFPLGGSR